MGADSTCPFFLAVSGRLARMMQGKEVLELLLQSPPLEATQTSHVFSRWTVTIGPASLGWLYGPAGATLEGRLAASSGELEGPAVATRTDYLVYCSQPARWPIRYHYQTWSGLLHR